MRGSVAGSHTADVLRASPSRRATSPVLRGQRFNPTDFVRQQRAKEEMLAARVGRNPTPPRIRRRSTSLDRTAGVRRSALHWDLRQQHLYTHTENGGCAHEPHLLSAGGNEHLNSSSFVTNSFENASVLRRVPSSDSLGESQSHAHTVNLLLTTLHAWLAVQGTTAMVLCDLMQSARQAQTASRALQGAQNDRRHLDRLCRMSPLACRP